MDVKIDSGVPRRNFLHFPLLRDSWINARTRLGSISTINFLRDFKATLMRNSGI